MILKKTYFVIAMLLHLLTPVVQAQKTNAQAQKTNPPKVDVTMVKAAFIFGFTKYVYWNNEDRMQTFKICVLNSDDIAQRLNQVAQIRQFRKDIPIEVITCRSVNDIKPCQILVVNGASKDNLWSAYAKIRNKNTLMIAENLVDYKKSMVSFVEMNGKLKYIANKVKVDEANLVTDPLFYTLAITKEEEWTSVFDKLKGGGNLDESDRKEIEKLWKNLQHDNASKKAFIEQMEDSIRIKTEEFNRKITEYNEEYNKVAQNIEQQKRVLAKQDSLVKVQESEIYSRGALISQQRNVIMIIIGLGIIVLLVLLFAVRSNYLRKKANKLLEKQKDEIAEQKHLVDEKQKEIVDSINYAKRIQTALIANDRLLNTHLPEHFVMYKPKDIVAGDFYWATPVKDGFLYITADCTGHGVPGAFMSLLNISKLSETINQRGITRPDAVLNDVRRKIIQALNPEGVLEESKDGMDAILCNLDTKGLKLHYAAANNSFCIVRNNDILVCKADKMPVGKYHDDNAALFTCHEIDLQRGDMIYTYTDGFEDQFGGERGKKFKQQQLKELMLRVAKQSMFEQKLAFEQAFQNWKGDLEQVDDVLLIGVRV